MTAQQHYEHALAAYRDLYVAESFGEGDEARKAAALEDLIAAEQRIDSPDTVTVEAQRLAEAARLTAMAAHAATAAADAEYFRYCAENAVSYERFPIR